MSGGTACAETMDCLLRGMPAAGVDTHTYPGILYAHAERFAAPEAVKPWKGIRDARAFADGGPEPELRLSIWTAAGAAPAPRPVWVRIPGGGFGNGTDDGSFNGLALAQAGGAVVVSVNHRAGPLGYMQLPGEEFAAANHAGNLDLVAALEWVRANIGSFGGDGDKVTLFSGIGGEAKLSCLMNMPAGRGLFHRVFLQTGTAGPRSRPSASPLTAALLRELRLDASRVGELRRLPVSRLLAAAEAAKAALLPGISSEFRPVADGTFMTAGWLDSSSTQGAQWPTLSRSWSEDSPLDPRHSAEDPLRDIASGGPHRLGTVRNTHQLFTWPGSNGDSPRQAPGHTVEVITSHLVRFRGQTLRARELQTIAVNAALISLANAARA
jgi:carboxylesterase type B